MQQDEHDQQLCRKALHWIGLSDLDLSALALCEAISIPDDEDIVDQELLVDPEWVSRRCSSLVRLVGQSSDYPNFQLAHFTVKEYLRSIKPQSNKSAFRFSEDAATLELMGLSLRFLNFPIFDRAPTVASSEIQRMAQRNEQHPLYTFAAALMLYNVRCGILSLCLEEETMMQYARELFNPEKTGKFLSWLLELFWAWVEPTDAEENFSEAMGILIAPEFSTLHVAAILALPSICKHLIDTAKVDLNICYHGVTPLHALLLGNTLLSPEISGFERKGFNRWHIDSNPEPRVYEQLHKCLQIFTHRGADTSIRWETASVLHMALSSSAKTEHNKLWIEPLIIPSTVVDEDFIPDFKAAVAECKIDRSILDAIVNLGSDPEAPTGWARLASLIQTRRMEDEDYQEGDIPLMLSDEDFVDSLRISLYQELTDTLRVLVQDSRFREDIYMPWCDSKSMPVLLFAIRPRGLSSVELLLEAGCDPNVVDESDGCTSLHECAFSDTDDGAITTLLLKSGATDSARDNLGNTCWHIAAEQGNIPVLKVLLDLGCDTKQSLATTSSAGRTPLASAILENEVDSALLLLDHCGAELEAFQSDESLLNAAAETGSADLFLRLHEKLIQADALGALQDARPLEYINMMCSPMLLNYLFLFWSAGSSNSCHILADYLLDASRDDFEDPTMYPRRDDMVRIIRRLLSPMDTRGYIDGNTTQLFWNIFCEEVVPYLTEACDGEPPQCRADLVIMSFEILIEVGVLGSYERNAHLPSYRIFFRSLLRRSNIGCAWIASSVQMVLEATKLVIYLSKEAVAGELLSRAMKDCNVDLVRQLLDHGVDVHAAHDSLSPVEQACISSGLPTFQLVIENLDKTHLNRVGSQGMTLLHWAVSGTDPGYLAKIDELLKLGANIEAKVDDLNADTSLTLASRNHRADIVALLVSTGADSLHRGSDGWSVLHAAADTGDLRYIRPLLAARPPDSFWLGTCQYNFFVSDGKQEITQNVTAVHLAAAKGRSSFLRFMTQHNIPFDVNAVTGSPALTPLHLASCFGQLEVVKFLISSKADINAKDADGWLAIDYAARDGHLQIFKTLLKSGSGKPLTRHSDSMTHLMSKEKGCTEEAGNSQFMSQFHFEGAIIRGDLSYCKDLVAKGQSINAELLTSSYTPLVRAIVEGQTEIVDWLVSLGVEVTNLSIQELHPSLRCIASLTTHYSKSPQTITAVLSLALRQNVSWFWSPLGPLHVAILDNKVERLDAILKHIRENDSAYRYDSIS